jgi:hypothetical protein
LAAHFGIKYGHYPLLRVKMKKWIACLLHANLRVTSGIVNYCVFAHLGKYGNARRRSRALRSRRCCRLRVHMCGSRKPKTKDLTAAYKKPISFVERDAEGINMLGDKMMNIVFPPDIRAKNTLYRNPGA